MGKSYKKNIKDKNIKGKESMKKEIRAFDDMLVFETEEQLSSAIETFFCTVDEEKIRKYIFAYIRYLLSKKEKKIDQWQRKKKTVHHLSFDTYKRSIERENKVLSYLNKRLEGENKKYKIEKSARDKVERRKITGEEKIEKSPSYEEMQILANFKQGIIDFHASYVFSHYVNAFCEYIKTDISDETFICHMNQFVDILSSLASSKIITREEAADGLYAICDILKYKIGAIDKNDTKRRDLYKRVKSHSEIALTIYKENKYKPKHDYYYDILSVLLGSPKNYYVIEKLLLTIPEFVNAKTWVYEKHGGYYQHIFYTIVDSYIRSYKLELRNQTKDFVPRSYFQKLYYLFLDHPYLDVDKDEIYHLLKDFLEATDQVNYLKNNKDAIMKEVGDMLAGEETLPFVSASTNAQEYLTHIEYPMIDIIRGRRERMDQKYLEKMGYYYRSIQEKWENPTKEQLKEIQRTLGISNRMRRNITLGIETIAFSDDHSYSIGYHEDGSYRFCLHDFDLHAVLENTPLEEYLCKALQERENMLLDAEKLKMGEKRAVPSITYEVKIAHNGFVGPLKIYISTSEVEKTYQEVPKCKDEKFTRFLSLYKMLTDDHKPNLDVGILDSYFLSFFGERIMDYAAEKSIPLIVKGMSDFDKEHYLQLHYSLCEIYSKIKKEHFRKIFEILSTHLEKPHFVNHNYDKGDYHIHLENDYVKYWNQKTLKEYLYQDTKSEAFQTTSSTHILESNEIMEKANQHISYVGDVKPIDKGKKKAYHK